MKTNKYLLIAAAAMTLAACSNDNEMTADRGPVAAQVYAGIGAMQSRAAGTSWDKGDEIGISCVTAGTTYNNVKYVTTAGDGAFTASDNHGIFFQSPEEVTFTAYYPFCGQNAFIPESGEPYTDGTGVISRETKEQTAQKTFDFMFATATASRKNPVLLFTGENAFKHKMTRLVIHVKTDVKSDFQSDHVFIGQYTLGGIKHSGTFNTATGEAEAIGNPTADWAITGALDDEQSNVRTYDMILFPQSGASLTFKAVIAGQTYVAPAITPALAAGTSYTYNITVKKTGIVVSSCTIDDWTSGTGGDVDATMPTE